MVGDETGAKYDPKGTDALRTEAYIMALKANRDYMIDGDTIPIVISKEKKRIKREEGKKKKISHARSLRQTYAIHRLTTVVMENKRYLEEHNSSPEDANLMGTERIFYNPQQEDIVYFKTTGGLTGGILADDKMVEICPSKSPPQYTGLVIGDLFRRQNRK